MCVSVLDVVDQIVYYPYMPSIVGKKRGNQTYYYLVESARMNGKPRIVQQQYLGSAEEVMTRLSGAPAGRPERTQHKKFGDLAAVWGILDRLGVAGAIDEVCGSRRSDAGASVGTYLALATLNRVVAPCSKLAFEQWWATTAGPRFTKVPVAATDHRRFWDAMDSLDTVKLAAAERAIAAAMLTQFGLDLSGLALDMTNFATFIDSANEAAPIAQRGPAKQKRNDLRLVGLALVVTRDSAIPVTSHTYPGNRPDVTQFGDVLDELTSRYAALFDTHDDTDAGGTRQAPTVMFDAGQNSAANFAHLGGTGLHFVGSLPPSDFPDLLAVPARRRHPVDPHQYPGLSAYDTRALVFATDRRVILTHSPTLHAAQSRGFDQTLTKTTRALDELAATLARGKTRREPAAVLAEITQITHPRWVRAVLSTELTGTTPADLRLTWHIDPGARKTLETAIFGKRLLVTDHNDWTTAEVVAGYRSQNDVESGFRRLKDPHVVGFSPMFQWTETKIRVPRLLPRTRPRRRPPHAPTSPPGRPGPQRPRTTRHPGRHSRDRSALPHREQRPTPRATHPHRHRPHPETPLRHLRTRHLRPPTLTWVIHHNTLKTGRDQHLYHSTTC